MGLVQSHLHMLAMEQINQPLKGDVITFGQQRVYASLRDVRRIFAQHNVPINDLPAGFDAKSTIPNDSPSSTNAHAVLKMLGADNVYAADVSNYENPDFVFDLNEPVGTDYENRFDVILDLGTLEHVFDVPTALENIVRMLKPGGIVILGYPVSNSIDHGFYSFSPTLFFDYFSVNGFSDFRCYLHEYSCHNLNLRSKVYKYTGVGGQFPWISPRPVSMLFWAKLQKKPTMINKPMQSLYVQLHNKSQEERIEQATSCKSSELKSLFRNVVDRLPTRIRRKVIDPARLIHDAVCMIPARIRPEIIDSMIGSKWSRFNKRDNLHYIGKF